MGKLESEKLKHFPNVNSLLKISLGMILFTIISTALVYAETMSVDVDGTSFDFDYTATGMTVTGVESDTDFISLIFTVDVTDSSGTLDVTFDRSFFDSVYQGADDDFIILADGDEPSFTETETTSQSRTLSIELPSGTEDVEIIGSVFGAPASEPEPETVEEEVMEEETVEEEVMEEETMEEVEETPKTQCGPGTILKDGACVLDERCGPGTILQGDVCVLDESSMPSGTSTKGIGKELVVGVAAAFVIAGAIGIVLGLISKASKSRD